jgi:hypothetical protein
MRLALAVLILAASACDPSRRPAAARSVIAPDAGLSADAVHTVVHAHVSAIRACYEQFAKVEGRPMGVVRFGWQIDPSGAVTSVELVASTLHSAAIESCIAADIARWRFPASPRLTEIRQYPFEL